MQSVKEIESQIGEAMRSDRHALRRRLRSIRQNLKRGRPQDRNLKRLDRTLQQSIERRSARKQRVPEIRYPGDLPVVDRRDEIAAAIREHPVVIVCGETGSGKSTQIPKICLELGRGIDAMIGHTQPRRLAARSVAARIAEELDTPLGEGVGYKVRFSDATGPNTYVKLMTDGILLAELQHDCFLDAYDTIIIDEAHERSLNIDFLLGTLKRLLEKRKDLKVIVTSATVDAAAMADHFVLNGKPAPVIEVSGRTYLVEVRYRPLAGDDAEEDIDWQEGILRAVDELASENGGDLLVFLPTERDIHETARVLRSRNLPGDQPNRQTEILPLYARLSAKDQQRIFAPHPHRRIVLATNVAESSLTVPGIRAVIDPGTARISRYSARSKVQRLPIEEISRASADQRKGRCGRIGPGVCIRLYSEEDYHQRDEFTAPEIQRTNLAGVILQTKAMGFGDVEDFPFPDPPKPTTVRDGYRTLFEIGALDERNELTELGRRLAKLPVDPRIGRMILAADEERVLHEVLIIAAALEIRDPRERPLERQSAADEEHARFLDERSDFLSYLKLWDFYHELREKLSRNQLRKACRENFLSYNRLREWNDLFRQLREVADRTGMKTSSRRRDPASTETYAAIHRALLSGLLSNVAHRPDKHEYTGAGGGKFHLWPGSGVFEKKPTWIVAAELVETSRRFLRAVARIDPKWIEPLAGHLVKRSYSEPRYNAKRGAAVADERVTLFGLPIVPRRTVAYGPIDPAASRELFIRHGLVEGGFETDAPFAVHNKQLLEELAGLQSKSRQFDFLVDEGTRYGFYDKRIPADVYDAARFQKWRRKAEGRDPKLLYMKREDLVQGSEDDVSAAAFPDALKIDGMRLPLSYHLEPGADEDGVTLTVPHDALGRLKPQLLGWLVPGLLEEKVTAMIKSLPKDLRRQLVPAPDTAKQVVESVDYGQGAFEQVVARALSRIADEPIRVQNFDLQRLPNHLRMNVRVVDRDQQELAAGRDLQTLQDEVRPAAHAQPIHEEDPHWTQTGLTDWTFGELPEKTVVDRGGAQVKLFPALRDEGDSVALCRLDSKSRAKRETQRAVVRLFLLAEHRKLRAQIDHLPKIDKLSLWAATLPDSARFRDQLAERLAERALLGVPDIPRNENNYRQLLERGRNRISLAVQDVAALTGPLLESYHAARLALEKLNGARHGESLADIESQLEHLIPDGFLSSTPWPWLQQYPRYFQALKIRLRKLFQGDLARDRRLLAELAPHVSRFRAALQSSKTDPELEHYGWMIEEYRVSLFAQNLGTAVKVSPERLERQWRKAGVGK